MDRSEVVGRLPSAGLFHRSEVHQTALMPDPPSDGTEAVGAGAALNDRILRNETKVK